MNPVKEFRIQNHLTQEELAQEVGVTRQVITNLESGLMLSLPQELASYMNPASPIIPQTDYLIYIKDTREAHSYMFTNPKIKFDAGWFSFKYSVQPNRSHRGFCRKLLYQPSALELYERTPRNSGPPSLIVALSDVGLTHDQIFTVMGTGVSNEQIKRALLQSGRMEIAPQ